MTLDEFREQFNGAPESMEDFARLIINNLTDVHLDTVSAGLYEAARAYVTALDSFEQAMHDSDVEIG